jgi:hypothetical protein
MRRTRRATVHTGLLLVGALLTATAGARVGAGAEQPPQAKVADQVPIAESPPDLNKIIEADIRFRRDLGLSADERYVSDLVRNYDFSRGTPRFALVTTPGEEAELVIRQALLFEMAEAERKLRESAPDDFGGLYLDHKLGGLVVVYHRNATKVADQIRASFSRPERVRVVEAVISLKQMEQATERITSKLEALHADGIGITAVGPDIARNRLLIEVSDDTPLERVAVSVSDVVASNAVEVRPGQVAKPEHWIVGGEVITTGGVSSCSNGFQVYQANTWLIYLLTAGHCADGNWTGVTSGHSVPWANSLYFNNSSADAQAHTSTWEHRSGYLWHYNVLVGVNSLGALGGASDQIGAYPICISGQFNRNCGTQTFRGVASVFFRIHQGTGAELTTTITFQNTRRATYYSQPGDSGGAIYHYNWPYAEAVGLHAGRSSTADRTYSHLHHALTAWGLTDVIRWNS